MKIKKEYIILAVIIAALSLYLSQRSTDRTLYQLPDVPKISNSDITKIEIDKKSTSIAISKKGDSWKIGPKKYPADTLKVKNMLDVMEKLTLTALVSESKSYNRYNLDDDHKITVKTFDKDKLKLELDIGKAASSFRHTFVKIAGDERVFHASGSFRGKFDTTVDDLRDKAVLEFKIKEIGEISITKGKDKMVFSRIQIPGKTKEPETSSSKTEPLKTTWQNAAGKKANNSKINRLLTTLSDLSCEKYISDRSKEEFKSPVYTLLLKGSKEYKLSIFEKLNKDNKDYPAISSENSYPFILSGSQVKSIMEDPGEMLEKKDKK
jgi:signal recognition particle subunit SEC65